MLLNRFYGDNRILKPLEYLKCGRCDKEYVEWLFTFNTNMENKMELTCRSCGTEFNTFIGPEDEENHRMWVASGALS